MSEHCKWPKSWKECHILLHSAGSLAMVILLAQVLDLKTLLQQLSIPLSARRSSASMALSVRFVDGFLRRLLRLSYFHKRRCFYRSLTLYRVALRNGYPVRIHFGVHRDDTALAGHAWLTLEGELFLEQSQPDLYTTTFVYPPEGDHESGSCQKVHQPMPERVSADWSSSTNNPRSRTE